MSGDRYPFFNMEPEDENQLLLPNEILDFISTKVDDATLVHGLSMLSKGAHALFADRVTEKQRAKQLLTYVMNGDPVSAEKLLKQHQQERPNSCLVTMRTKGKELNSRQWQAVSAIMYAAWAGDMTNPKHHMIPGMLNMLLHYVPTQYQPLALEQLSHVRDKGTEHGKLLASFYSLIEEYRWYKDNIGTFHSQTANSEYCITHIGIKQLLLPVFGLQWFCDPLPFIPSPVFNRSPKRTLELAGVPLLPLTDSALGKTFYLYKGSKGNVGRTSMGGVVPELFVRMIGALEKLCGESVASLDALIVSLQIAVEPIKTQSLSK